MCIYPPPGQVESLWGRRAGAGLSSEGVSYSTLYHIIVLISILVILMPYSKHINPYSILVIVSILVHIHIVIVSYSTLYVAY